MTPLPILLFIVLLVWFWQISVRSRDLAIQTARRICADQGVQFLDGTASLQTIRPGFSRTHGPGFKRTYTFDYSPDGIGRQSGCIIMYNTKVLTILLESG